MKKKLFKKSIILMIIFSLCVCLNGCGKDKKVNSNVQRTTVEETTKTEKSDLWEINNSKTAVRSIVTGRFNDETNTDSFFAGFVYIQEILIVEFKLLKFGKTEPVYDSDDELTIEYKVDNEIKECKMRGEPPNGDLLLDTNYINDFKDYLKEGKNISCKIIAGSSEFNFDVKAENFNEVYSMLD